MIPKKEIEVDSQVTEQHIEKASRIGKWMGYLLAVFWLGTLLLMLAGDRAFFIYISDSQIQVPDEFQTDKFDKIGIINGRFITVSYADLEFSQTYLIYSLVFGFVVRGLWLFAALYSVFWLAELFKNIKRKYLFIYKNIVLLRKLSIVLSALILLPNLLDLLLYFIFSFGTDSNPFYTAKWIDVGYTYSTYLFFELLLLALLITFYWFAVVARELYKDSEFTV